MVVNGGEFDNKELKEYWLVVDDFQGGSAKFDIKVINGKLFFLERMNVKKTNFSHK